MLFALFFSERCGFSCSGPFARPGVARSSVGVARLREAKHALDGRLSNSVFSGSKRAMPRSRLTAPGCSPAALCSSLQSRWLSPRPPRSRKRSPGNAPCLAAQRTLLPQPEPAEASSFDRSCYMWRRDPLHFQQLAFAAAFTSTNRRGRASSTSTSHRTTFAQALSLPTLLGSKLLASTSRSREDDSEDTGPSQFTESSRLTSVLNCEDDQLRQARQDHDELERALHQAPGPGPAASGASLSTELKRRSSASARPGHEWPCTRPCRNASQQMPQTCQVQMQPEQDGDSAEA